MLTKSMFIVGAIIFTAYIIGLVYMINWANKTQNQDMNADPTNKKNQFKQ